MRSPWLAVRSVVVLLLLSALLVSFTMVAAAGSLRADDKILGGLWVEGIQVGALTVAQARGALAGRAKEALDRRVVLRHQDSAFEVSIRELGGRADVDAALAEALAIGREERIPSALATRIETLCNGRGIALRVVFDAKVLKARLTRIASQLNRPPKAAQLSLSGIELAVQPHTVGWALDVAATAAAIERALGTAFVGEELTMVVTEKAPEITAELLEKYEVLGHFGTRFNPGQTNRSENLRIAAAACNDVVIASGGVFSLNATTGPRTPARGYKLAGVYVGQRTVLGYGGGVCQVSTTAYNAALTAGMKIIERHGHSQPVPYVPWGRDATVSWGLADMKFQNNTRHPAIMKMWLEGNMLNASVLGIPDRLPEQDLLRAADELVHQANAALEAEDEGPEPDGINALLSRGLGPRAF